MIHVKYCVDFSVSVLVSWTSADPLVYQRLFNGNFRNTSMKRMSCCWTLLLLPIGLCRLGLHKMFLISVFEIFLKFFWWNFLLVDSSNTIFKEDRQINDNDEVLDIDVEICLSSRASFEEGKEILSQKNVMFSCISGKKFVYLFLRRSVPKKEKHIYLMPLPMLGPLDGKRSEKSRFFSWSEIKLWCC